MPQVGAAPGWQDAAGRNSGCQALLPPRLPRPALGAPAVGSRAGRPRRLRRPRRLLARLGLGGRNARSSHAAPVLHRRALAIANAPGGTPRGLLLPVHAQMAILGTSAQGQYGIAQQSELPQELPLPRPRLHSYRLHIHRLRMQQVCEDMCCIQIMPAVAQADNLASPRAHCLELPLVGWRLAMHDLGLLHSDLVRLHRLGSLLVRGDDAHVMRWLLQQCADAGQELPR
mmetsp:Transcript_16016/g.32536  ORF Transcript_16016/g.32536 Transcript_16016/m.32536 type:complete len:229 (-) Transcript_16016:413-1099(-)